MSTDTLPAITGRLLAAEFPGWDFGMQDTIHGRALVAIRRDQAGQPGTCAVITASLRELRRALRGEA